MNWEIPVFGQVSVPCARVQPRKLPFPLYVLLAAQVLRKFLSE